jgi:outer membrane biosynthesis protein TonB
MLLAGILALWMLFSAPCAGALNSRPAFATACLGTSTQQNPTPPQTSAQSSNSQQTTPPAAEKPAPPPKHKHKKKTAEPTSTNSGDTPPKKVVSNGSTETPTTHLAPSMTDEQTAKTRAANTDLLAQAGANLQKVNGRTLTAEQEETAEQVRKFVEQSKAADQEGDLQRAGTLATKAKLLSDSLEETSRPK